MNPNLFTNAEIPSYSGGEKKSVTEVVQIENERHYLIRVGAKDLNACFRLSSHGNGRIRIYRAPTVREDGDGTVLDSRNYSTKHSDAALSVFTAGADIRNDGTLRYSNLRAGATIDSDGWFGFEANSVWMVKIDNDSGTGAFFGLVIDFFELGI